jgi:hypothetical protein
MEMNGLMTVSGRPEIGKTRTVATRTITVRIRAMPKLMRDAS